MRIKTTLTRGQSKLELNIFARNAYKLVLDRRTVSNIAPYKMRVKFIKYPLKILVCSKGARYIFFKPRIIILKCLPNAASWEPTWVSGENVEGKARSPPFSSRAFDSTVQAVSCCKETSFSPSWLFVSLTSIFFVSHFRWIKTISTNFRISSSSEIHVRELEAPWNWKSRMFKDPYVCLLNLERIS